MSKVASKFLVIHCSDSDFGSAALIDRWHRERGFSKIGYHRVYLNGYECRGPRKKEDIVGAYEVGRSDSEVGAHCAGLNAVSDGWCIIGKKSFDEKLLNCVARDAAEWLRERGLPVSACIGHYETDSGKRQGKTCPNINMDEFRTRVKTFYDVKK
jgi:hypothetical protein